MDERSLLAEGVHRRQRRQRQDELRRVDQLPRRRRRLRHERLRRLHYARQRQLQDHQEPRSLHDVRHFAPAEQQVRGQLLQRLRPGNHVRPDGARLRRRGRLDVQRRQRQRPAGLVLRGVLRPRGRHGSYFEYLQSQMADHRRAYGDGPVQLLRQQLPRQLLRPRRGRRLPRRARRPSATPSRRTWPSTAPSPTNIR